MAGREGGAAAQVDHPFAGIDAAAQLCRVHRFGQGQVDGSGTFGVDDAHVRVVGRIRAQAGQQLVDIGLLVVGQGRIVLPLVTDGRAVAAGRCRRTEAAETVGRIDLDVVAEFAGQPADRVELCVGELDGVVVVDQIGAPGRAVQHGAAGEHPDRRTRLVAQDITHVRVRVTRRVQDGKAHRSDVDDVPVGHRSAGEAHVVAVRDDVFGAEGAGEFQPAGHVVVVDMGLENMGDRDAVLAGEVEDPVDVALRVDHRAAAVGADQVAAVAEAGCLDDGHVHGVPPV